jgi:hypothetical protein
MGPKTEKNATKNILDGRKDGRTDRGKTVYLPPPSGSGGIIKISLPHMKQDNKDNIRRINLNIRISDFFFMN